MLVKLIGLGIFLVGKFILSPLVLFIYKNILRIKIKTKRLQIKNLNYTIFIRKYLPSIVIIIIIISSTTHNILAKNYSADEYANRTMLSAIASNANLEEGWSELTEESRPAINQNQVVAYLEEQGNLQQVVVNTPFAEDTTTSESGTSPDNSSLVLITPEDTETLQEIGTSKRTESITYTVQSGDVIGKIAEQFGISANTILWENNLSWNSTIRPGQKLTILPDSGITHEVASGDTILAIAKKYQTTADKIVDENKLADASDIRVGDLLFIPDGVKPTQVVSSYKPIASVYSDEDVAPAQNTNTGTKLLWPVLSHTITQYYHWGHSAIDIGDKTGNPIYAAEAGKVERAGWNSGYGYNVIINHGNGIKTLYGHASKLLVQAGDSVSRGETIALIGSTGWSTGPHLHFEVRVNEVKQNPLNYIK